MTSSRRSFLKTVSAGAGATTIFGSAVISSGISPVPDDDDRGRRSVEFQHGVASGDPLEDRLIIWTRVTPVRLRRKPLAISVSFEVALDPNFKKIVRRGRSKAFRWRDYTVKVDLVGLSPNTEYYYRFKSSSVRSPEGRGKTLPVGEVSQVKLAVMSCSNYPAGYFNVYQDVSLLPEIDAVCHLGDYIYEYGVGGYASENADAIGRGYLPGNDTELLRLQDYRTRYAQYRTDAGAQALHAHAPFICVWDDHEVANDAWIEGAENHNEGEGSFQLRKLQAIRAYFEWMPIRPPSKRFASDEIYRRFDFGDLLTLHMLDTRIIGRDQQLDYANYINPADGSFDAIGFATDVGDPQRTILGSEQLSWLTDGLVSSQAKWQVLGQQVLMGKMTIPAELLIGLGGDPAETGALLAELASIKFRILNGDESVTDFERARVETVLPYNLDAWDGYFTEREILFGTAVAADKNLVCLAGDTHNAWANNLVDINNNCVGVEFAASSVTSPGLEAFLGLEEPADVFGAEFALETLIDGLKYTNLSDRGYLVVTFTPEEATGEWTFIDNILDTSYNRVDFRAKQLKVLPGSGPEGRKLIDPDPA